MSDKQKIYIGAQKMFVSSCAVRGRPGKSAYEVAVEQGFEGTEAEFGDFLVSAATAVALRLADVEVPTMADTSTAISINDLSPSAGVKIGDIIIGTNYYIGIVASNVEHDVVAVAGTGHQTVFGGVKTVNHAQPDTNGNVSLLPWQLQYSNTIAGQSVADVEEALDALVRKKFELPSGGQSGQVLVSNGSEGASWTTLEDTSGLPNGDEVSY